MSETMELTRDTLETIGGYVKENLSTWMREASIPQQTDPVLLERMIRVEEELKAQRELMKRGFDQVDKRFEQVDKRFEQVDKRFEEVNSRFEQVDKRFEEMRADMNSRFEQVDKRFEETRADINTRFDQARSHMNQWMTFMSIVLLALTAVVSLGIFFAG